MNVAEGIVIRRGGPVLADPWAPDRPGTSPLERARRAQFPECYVNVYVRMCQDIGRGVSEAFQSIVETFSAAAREIRVALSEPRR